VSGPRPVEPMRELVFPDPSSYADLVTLVRRARTADPDGAVRLHVAGKVLGVWAAALPGTGLFAEGAAIGVRGIELAEAGALDVVVPSAALADRFARAEGTPGSGPGSDGDVGAPTRLPVPPAGTHTAWAGALPAGPWEQLGEVDPTAVLDAASAGIAEIAAGAGRGPAGALAVAELRHRVWSRPLTTDAPGATVPAGAGFAAFALGLVRPTDPPVPVYRCGRWVRLRGVGGHILAR